MKLSRFPHYIKRVAQLGTYQTAVIIKNRAQRYFFMQHWKRLALQKKATHSWSALAKALRFSSSYEHWHHLVKPRLQQLALFAPNLIPDNEHKSWPGLLAQARAGCVQLLGAAPYCINQEGANWHEDFRLKQRQPAKECSFASDLFYTDIHINVTQGWEEGKDIKLPWELSRLQDLFLLAYEFHTQREAHDWQRIEKCVTNWIEKNPYLLGPNWVCPMEVGLRALNLVWIVVLCAPHLSPSSSLEKIIGALYDHFFYLEHNWEVYDGRTSNHYLSDLVGYLYCCWLFLEGNGVKQKARECCARIEREMMKQVFAEGTNYEGSTAYHNLVLELFHHAALLAPLVEYKFSQAYYERLKAMAVFRGWCSYVPNAFVTIGDNDSGKVLRGIDEKMLGIDSARYQGKKEFPAFGLSVIKTELWHLTLRHHAYHASQPSGHFHNDAASVSIAYKGQPIIIDPGSYVYTAASSWRNLFRSASMHNTFGIDHVEPVTLDQRLFVLELPEQRNSVMQTSERTLLMHHLLYKNYGVRAVREVALWSDEQKITITDWWEPLSDEYAALAPLPTWRRFVLDPTVKAELTADPYRCQLSFASGVTFCVIAQAPLAIHPCYVSPAYGVKEESLILESRASQAVHEHFVTTIMVRS